MDYRVLDLSQHPGAYGHGGQDPIGVINILQTADIFMTISLPGVTTAQCHRSGLSFDVIKVPPIAVHVVQWLADLKVNWRVIDMDGSVFEGLDPIYYFLQHHRLRHRNDNGNFGFGGADTVEGKSASIFGTANPRSITSSSGSFVVPMSVGSRMDQIGCGSPPNKVQRTASNSVPPIRQSSPIKMSDKLSDSRKLPAPKPRKGSVVGSGANLKKSFEVIQGQKSSEVIKGQSIIPVTKEFQIDVPKKCRCMDSFGYLPYGCFCDTKTDPKPQVSVHPDPRSPTEIIDALDIHAPDDQELFAESSRKDDKMIDDGFQSKPSTPSNTFLDQKSISSNTFLDQKAPVLNPLDEIPLQPGDVAVYFPPILPPNPPGRRIPPIFRWEIHARRRPTEPSLPTTTERRQIFMDSIRPVKFDKSMKGKEYDAVHDFEWKTCLG